MKLFDIILENIDLDEGGVPPKPIEDWLKDFKSKFPNWDYSKAEFFKDEKQLKIKNVYCTIHKHFFPEKGRIDGIRCAHHINGTGCSDCRSESQSKKTTERLTKSEDQWRQDLSKIKHLKNKCDFSKTKFLFVEPLKNGPLVTNTYCKIHKKYFNGGVDDRGVRAGQFAQQENTCPDCMKDYHFNTYATSFEDWIKIFKSNKINKNYDYSKSEIYYDEKHKSWVNNIFCKVKSPDGEVHGFFAKDGVGANSHSIGFYQCPKCDCENRTKDFVKQSIETHKDKYDYDMVDFCDRSTIIKTTKLDGKYDMSRKVLIGCKKHGHFFQDATKHKTGTGCPICRESKGELYVNSLLEYKYGRKYEILRFNDATFKELKGKRNVLPFDFYIPELKVVIEYDGQHHFWPVFGTSEYIRNLNYNKTITNDNLKNDFVKNNPDGIRLIRIPYTLEFSDIRSPLLKAIKETPKNQIKYLGDYPRRQGRKEAIHPKKIAESKLSLIGTLNELDNNK
jgi:very-short-patch-repair endonuclease